MGQKLRGLVAQGMDGRKPGLSASLSQLLDTSTPGAGTFTALATGTLLIYAWGGGASGGQQSSGTAAAGGGSEARYLAAPVVKGQVIPYSVGAGGAAASDGGSTSGMAGNPGADTTIDIPAFQTIICKGGLGGATGIGAQPGAGGSGGSGGSVVVPGNPGITTVGGLSASLSAVTSGLSGTPGAGGASNTSPGGSSTAGTAGRVLIDLVRRI
jgi:hypothetical protein